MTAPTVEAPPPQAPRKGLTAAQIVAILALVQAQAAVRAQLTQTAINAAVAAFSALAPSHWWDGKHTGKTVRSILRIVAPAQLQAARVSDAYLARAASLVTGRRVRPAGAVGVTTLRRTLTPALARELAAGKRTPGFVDLGDTVDGPSSDIDAPFEPSVPIPPPRAGAPAPRARRRTQPEPEPEPETDEPEPAAPAARATRPPRRTEPVPALDPGQPYGRIADAYRYQVTALGVSEETARQKALLRAASTAETDITLAVREQYRRTLGAAKADGYRRVLHPELSESGPCGLCVVAADRLYRIEELMPIHERCACTVLPVYGDLDPGFTLNYDDLDRLYTAAGEHFGRKQRAAAFKKVRVGIAEHGELGPVLVNVEQRFRGLDEVARAEHPDKTTRDRTQLEQLEQSVEILELRALRGDKVDKSLTWQRERIATLRRQLGE